MTEAGRALPAEALRASYAEAALPESTSEIAPLSTVAGQLRALEAIRFGLAMEADGYNIAVAGPRGSGRNTAVGVLVSAAAAERPAVHDWVYLHNFADPYRPRAVSLAEARGDDLKRGLAGLVRALETDLPAAFESEDYQERSRELLAPIARERQSALEELNRSAQQHGFAVSATPAGFMAAPLGRDGQPMPAEVFRELPDTTREEFERRGEEVQGAIVTAVRALRALDKRAGSEIESLNAEVARFALQPVLEELRADFPEAALQEQFAAIEADVVEHLGVLRSTGMEAGPFGPAGGPPVDPRRRLLRRYDVNLFVTHGEEPAAGAPVVDERQPTFTNLFGRLDYEAQFGTVTTDFLQIRPGAVHRANGGYLILQAEDVLADSRSWWKLKRTLKTKEARVEDAGDFGVPLPMLHLAPEPIPLDLKVVLVGTPLTIAVMDALDPDFQPLFKIRAEFEPDTGVDTDTIGAYAAFICREAGLCATHFDRSAMREVLRYGNRLAGRQDRLSTQFSAIGDLCQEAHQLAHAGGSDLVTGEFVQQAVATMSRRAALVPDRMRRMIAEGTLHIETSGAVVGQVNGLAVYGIGRQLFGTPMRITCRVGAGRLGVVNIERETERSGAIHTKGVLVLAGFLMGTFGREKPLSFSGSVTFEQSYDEVDGDSASSAELYAILTALARVPMRQDVAVTGSLDQFGNIQPVGGVTAKVEGFFDVCSTVGLTGSQGVIIPASNVVNLTLREDVVEAVEAGQFHLWAVGRVEEGLALLTGEEAGERQADGAFPPGTIFRKVADALASMQAAPPLAVAGVGRPGGATPAPGGPEPEKPAPGR